MVPSRAAMRTDNDTAERPGASPRATVLFLTANPSDTTRLSVGEEYREVHNRLLVAGCRERVELVFAPEVRVTELAQLIQRYEPAVVHFSGHGDDEGALLLSDAAGRASAVSVEQLAALFAALSRDLRVRCVVLNACHSEALAVALSAHVDCVLGLASALRDKTAVTFAGAFYEALAYGRDVASACEVARAQSNLALASPGELPSLHVREGAQAEAIHPLLRSDRQWSRSQSLYARELPDEPSRAETSIVDELRAALSSAVAPDRAKAPLTLSCQVVAKSLDGETRSLGPGDAVAAGERVRLYVTTSRDAYVTLLEARVDGTIEVLVPRETEAEMRLEAGVETRLPGPKSSVMFDAPFGPEELFIVASETPWKAHREALRSEVRGAPSRSSSRAALASLRRKAVVVDDDEGSPEGEGEGVIAVWSIALQSTPERAVTTSAS